MAAQLTQKAARWPLLYGFRTVLVHAAFNPPNLSQSPVPDKLAQCLKVGIKTTVLIDAQNHALSLGGAVQLHRPLGIGRKRFVGNNMQTCSNRFQYQIAPGLRWRGDCHSITAASSDQRRKAGKDRGVRPVGTCFGHRLRCPRDDCSKAATRRCGNEWRVEMLPARAIADHPYLKHCVSPLPVSGRRRIRRP